MKQRLERHNGSHQSLRNDSPWLYGDHMSDECEDRDARFKSDYAPGTGERADDDPAEALERFLDV